MPDQPWDKYLKEEDASEKIIESTPPVTEGKLIHLPVKRPDDEALRLEQNLGCELPVTVGNCSDIHQESIQVTLDDEVAWKLTRTADSLLPSPQHYRYWLWALDRWQDAFHKGYTNRPRIRVIPKDLFVMFGSAGRIGSGHWYQHVDEGFHRFSRMVITNSQAFHFKERRMVKDSSCGTLCDYVSWRGADGVGWLRPGPLIWTSITEGYLKAVPWKPIKQLENCFPAQRLLVYLSKHCPPGGSYKVGLAKLIEKIPMTVKRLRLAKECLAAHHARLEAIGFLSRQPEYEGRGSKLAVVYHRKPATY